MKLTDKRFWIFEAFTIIYAGLLMLLELIIFGKSLTGEIMLFIIAWCCITGSITWPFANGKHWFVFGLIYEALFIILLFAYLIIDGVISGLLEWFSLKCALLLFYRLLLYVSYLQ